jgi:hypothetical protein
MLPFNDHDAPALFSLFDSELSKPLILSVGINGVVLKRLRWKLSKRLHSDIF